MAHGALAGDAVAALFPPRVLRLHHRQRCMWRRHLCELIEGRARDKSAESNAWSRRRCACFISTHLLPAGDNKKRPTAGWSQPARASDHPSGGRERNLCAHAAPLSKHYTCINRRLYTPFKTKTSASRGRCTGRHPRCMLRNPTSAAAYTTSDVRSAPISYKIFCNY